MASTKRKADWQGVETWQRLVAAIVATGVRIDLHDVATMYGTTYDTIQNRYRKIRKEADELRAAVDSGELGLVATPKKGTKSAAGVSTPRKTKGALNTVTNGRVSKASPAKKASTPKGKVVNEEKKDSAAEEEDIFAGMDFGGDLGDVGMEGDEFLL